MRYLLLCLLLISGCNSDPVSSIALPDGGRAQIDCADSAIAFTHAPGSYKCERFAKTLASGDTNAANGTFQRFNLYGATEDGVYLSIQTFKVVTSRGHIIYDPNETAGLHNFNDTTKSGQSWSPLRPVGNAHLSNFVADNGRKCFAFHEPGGVNAFGLSSIVFGVFCGSFGSPQFTDDQVIELLSKIAVT